MLRNRQKTIKGEIFSAGEKLHFMMDKISCIPGYRSDRKARHPRSPVPERRIRKCPQQLFAICWKRAVLPEFSGTPPGKSAKPESSSLSPEYGRQLPFQKTIK